MDLLFTEKKESSVITNPVKECADFKAMSYVGLRNWITG